MLVRDLHIRVINAATGELLRELTLDPPATTSPPASHPAPNQNDPEPNEGSRSFRCPATGQGGAEGIRTPDPLDAKERLTRLERAERMTTARPPEIDLGQLRPGSQEPVPPVSVTPTYARMPIRSRIPSAGASRGILAGAWAPDGSSSTSRSGGARNTAGPMGRARSHRRARARGGYAARR